LPLVEGACGFSTLQKHNQIHYVGWMREAPSGISYLYKGPDKNGCPWWKALRFSTLQSTTKYTMQAGCAKRLPAGSYLYKGPDKNGYLWWKALRASTLQSTTYIHYVGWKSEAPSGRELPLQRA
jgi:hypothetical protein